MLHRTSNNFSKINISDSITISDGTNKARLKIRNGDLVIQYTKTALGFSGVENTDWAETGFAQDVSD